MEPEIKEVEALPVKQRGFGAFLRRHDALFSMLGAFIVFTTFVVRDGLKARYEREAGALSAAESMYELRLETATTDVRLKEVAEQLRLRAGEADSAPAKPSTAYMKTQALYERFLVAEIENHTQERLTESLFQASGQSLGSGFYPSDAQLAIGFAQAMTEQPSEFSGAEIQQQLRKAESAVSELEVEVSDQDRSIRAAVYQRKERLSALAGMANGVSVLLFCIGWALSVADKWAPRI